MTWYEKLDKVIGDYLSDLPMERDVPMDRFTSFRIGGPARRLACPKNREQMVILMGLARECGARPFIMGNGTNLLIPDRGLDRLVIRTAGEMSDVRLTGETVIEADAGISLSRLALFAQSQALTGLEFAHGIPGFTAVDSIRKKIAVVEGVTAGLGLRNLEPRCARAETLPERYDYVVSRAVTAMSEFVNWVWNRLERGQRGTLPNGILYLKGGDLAEELALTGKRWDVYDIARFFEEEFFETKKVVYTPKK